MRINRYLAAATGASRRAADEAVRAGRVNIEGRVAMLGDEVMDTSRVLLDGVEVTLPKKYTYVVLNKPEGYVSSRRAQGEVPTVYALLPADLHHLKLVGRLDQDSCGLLLLTDDGALAQTLTHPSHEKPKRYRLVLTRPLTEEDATKLEAGIELVDGPSRMRVITQEGREVLVELTQGRNRQIRRTMGTLNYGIITLERIGLGALKLDRLKSGEWRFIEQADITTGRA